MKKLLTSLALGVILTLGFLAGILPPSSADGPQTADGSSVQTDSIINTFESVADYIVKYGRLPDNFITKAEAAKLGWEPQKGNLAEVAPGKASAAIFSKTGKSCCLMQKDGYGEKPTSTIHRASAGRTGSSIQTTGWSIKRQTTIKLLLE